MEEKDLESIPFEELAGRYGISLKDEEEKAKEGKITFSDKDFKTALKPKAKEPLTEDVTGAVKGVTQGAALLTQDLINAGIDLADYVRGMGGAVPVKETNKIDWSSFTHNPNDPAIAAIMRDIIAYGAPVVASMVAGGGVIPGLAAGAAIDFAVFDPDQKRLSETLLEKYPSLKEVHIVGDLLEEWTEGEDSDFTRRLKAAAEGSVLGAGIYGALRGAAKVVDTGRKMSKAAKGFAGSSLEAINDTGKKIDKAVKGMEEKVATETTEAAAKGKAAIKQEEILPNPEKYIPMEDGPFVTRTKEGLLAVNLQSRKAVDNLAQHAYASKVYSYEQTNLPAVLEEAQNILKSEELTSELLNRVPGERMYTPAETKAIELLSYEAVDPLVEAAKQVNPNDPQSLATFQHMFDSYQMVTSANSVNRSEVGLSFRVMQDDIYNSLPVSVTEKIKSAQGKSKRILKEIELAGGAGKIEDLANKISLIADADPQLLKTFAQKKGNFRKFVDMVEFSAIQGMMNTATATTNFVNNGLALAGSVFENYAQVAASRVLPGVTPENVKTLESAHYATRAAFNSLTEAMVGMYKSLKSGQLEGPAKVISNKFDTFVTNPISSEALELDPTKFLGQVADKAGAIVGLPGRLGVSGDSFFRTVLYRMKTTELLYESARNAVKAGNIPADKIDDFIKANAMDVSTDIHNRALKYVEEYTLATALSPERYKNEFLKGTMQVGGFIQETPGLRTAFPFAKISYNIMEYKFKRSPLALLAPNIRKSIMAGGREGQEAAAKVASGTLFLGLGAAMYSMGMLSGREPENFKLKQAIEESGKGKQPNSIKVGDTWVNLEKLDVLGGVFKLGATLAQLGARMNEDDYLEATMMAAGALVEYLTPEMMMDSYADFFSAVGEMRDLDPGKQGEAIVAQLAGRYIPMQGMVKQVKRYVDPIRRDTTLPKDINQTIDRVTSTIVERYKANNPIFSKDAYPKVNIFGEPLLEPEFLGLDVVSPFVTTSGKESKLVTRLKELAQYETLMGDREEIPSLNLAIVPNTVKMSGVTLNLSQEEHYKYQMYAAGKDPETGKALDGGITLREALENAVDSVYKSLKLNEGEMSPVAYERILGSINKVVRGYREAAKGKILEADSVKEKLSNALSKKTQFDDNLLKNLNLNEEMLGE